MAVTPTTTNTIANINSLAVGDTFTMDGIEWRKLMKQGTQTLIVAEHTVVNVGFHSQNSGAYPKWSASYARAYLNSTAAGQFLNGKTVLQGAVQEKTLYTRIQGYGTGASNYTAAPNLYETTEDKVFLLGAEETYYTGTDSTAIPISGGGSYKATTDIADIRTNGTKVIFADQNARKFSGTSSWYWVRTPSNTDASGGTLTPDTGTGLYPSYYSPLNSAFGYRPAAWVVQQ